MNTAWHDDQYLFRLTSTFGWDEAISFCDGLLTGIERVIASAENGETHVNYSSQLFNDSLQQGSIQSNDCKSLEEWLHHAERALMYRDQWGNTPLHAASYVHPPVHVIDALFRVGRAIWKYNTKKPEMPIWAMTTNDNSTPFLVAASTGTDVDGLRRYLDEIDYYIERNWAPSSFRMVVLQPDNQGTTPFMGWMAFHHGYFSHIKIMGGSRDPLTSYVGIAKQMLWFATMHVYPDYPTTKEMLLQRCTLIARQLPEELFQLLLFQDEDAIAMFRDEMNRLPLHNAIDGVSVSSRPFNNLIQRNDSKDTTPPMRFYNHERNRMSMIENLLHWYPNAARVHFTDSGRSPLCQALAHGDHWHITKDKTTYCAGVIKILCEQAPDKLEERDVVTGLYPFMLAATDSNGTGVVETVYELLKRCPQPIIDCTHV